VSEEPPKPAPAGKRRWFARDPMTRSVILEVGDVRARVGHGTQRRVLGLIVGPVVKFAVGAVLAGAAGLMAWRC